MASFHPAATIARIMVGGCPFCCYAPGIAKREGKENDRLDAGAYHGSRRRLCHSISADGPKIPYAKKRPLGPVPFRKPPNRLGAQGPTGPVCIINRSPNRISGSQAGGSNCPRSGAASL
jgi:hypothetical protein